MPDFGRNFARFRSGTEPVVRRWPQSKRAELTMADNNTSTGFLGAVLGGIVAVAAVVFLITGGEFGGTKKVQGDADLPPVASPTSKPTK
jgi:hypothetical protein